MSDGWEPPSEAECQACWDGLKAKLATAEHGVRQRGLAVVLAKERIAELETERAALLAEVKRLTADVKRACAMVGLGRNMDALILLSRMVNSSKPSGDAKRDPISPKDPLERA